MNIPLAMDWNAVLERERGEKERSGTWDIHVTMHSHCRDG